MFSLGLQNVERSGSSELTSPLPWLWLRPIEKVNVSFSRPRYKLQLVGWWRRRWTEATEPAKRHFTHWRAGPHTPLASTSLA